jgi:hypothetical protein
MRDAIGGLIGRYDQLGRYLDRSAIDSIETYLDESSLRIQAVELINREAAEIVREASQRLFRDEPELLLPVGMLTPPDALRPVCGIWTISSAMPVTHWLRQTAQF